MIDVAFITSKNGLVVMRIITSRLRNLTEKYAVLEASQFGFRNARAVQLVIQKARWLTRQAMKSDGKLIRVDLDFKNAFNSAGHSCLWRILEGFGVPDVALLKDIYENSSMRIQVEGTATAAIQLDTGTVQGSTLSPLLFDLFINALLRLLDTSGISHKVKNLPEWNHQAFADDLSLYVSEEHDAQTLLDLVAEFQEWSGLKISIKKTIVTGALYGKGAARRNELARNMGRQQAKAGSKRSRGDTIAETQEGEYDFETEVDPKEIDPDDEGDMDDLEVNDAVVG